MIPNKKELFFRSVGLTGVYPTRLTRRQEIIELIRALRPTPTGIELIRLGPKGDGGYLVPDDLGDIGACYSPGVSDNSGFEKDCARRGLDVFLADRSVDGPAEPDPRFHFTKKFLGAATNDEFMTLDDWVDTTAPNSTAELLLQIDIEGYEYETFLAMSSRLARRFRIIVAEFHMLERMWSEPFFAFAASALRKILQTHVCVHLHPNNVGGALVMGGIAIPRVMEFTFLRRDRIRSQSGTLTLPHPLDSDNTGNPPLPLPRVWYRDSAN